MMTVPTPPNPQSKTQISGKHHGQTPGSGAYCVLNRITDSIYLERAKYSCPITPQYVFRGSFGDTPEDELNFAQYYTGMRLLFGKPGNRYDDWKGSFSFSFQVDVVRNGHSYAYLLNILNLRSTIEFHFRKILDDSESQGSLQAYRDPLQHEFSDLEMLAVQYFMHGYLKGYLEVIQKNGILDCPDFVLVTESNLIISGYINGQFFEHAFEDLEDFEAERDLYQNLIDSPVADWPGDSKTSKSLMIRLEHPQDG